MNIGPLKSFSFAQFKSLSPGYISDEIYRVERRNEGMNLSLHLLRERLTSPYTKDLSILDEEVMEKYHQLGANEYSFGLWDRGTLKGIALSEPIMWNRCLWIWELHLHPEVRGHGWGRKLVEAVVEKAKEGDFRLVAVEAQNTNVPALDFYQKVGFTLEGIDLSYYTNGGEIDGEVAVFLKRKLC